MITNINNPKRMTSGRELAESADEYWFSVMQQQRKVSEIQRTIDNLPLKIKIKKWDIAAWPYRREK